MSRTPAAHLAGLKLKYPEWRFERIAAARINPPTGRGGYYAQRRDRPEISFFADTVDALEAMIVSWREPGSGNQPDAAPPQGARPCV